MKKNLIVTIIALFSAISIYGQQLSFEERTILYQKNPNAFRVYQDRVNELENIIRKAEEKIEWLKVELKMNTGEPNAANSQIHNHIEQENAKIKEAKRNLESACRYYRNLANKKEEYE